MKKFLCLIGTGGIGSGMFFSLEGGHNLGRNESRNAKLLPNRDFCKQHIILHYPSIVLGKALKVIPVGRVGDDDPGEMLFKMMEKAGMEMKHVKRESGSATLFSVCFQYPDKSGGNITTSNGASGCVSPKDISEAEGSFKKYAGRGIALAAPEVPLAARKRLLELATKHGFFRIGAVTSSEAKEAKKLRLFSKMDLVCLNEDEAGMLAGVAPTDIKGILKKLPEELEKQNPRIMITMTLGSKGAYAYDGCCWKFAPCFKVKASSTAGAGDAFVAGVIISMVKGLPLSAEGKEMSGLILGSLLASMSVISPDTINTDINKKTLSSHANKFGYNF